MSRRRFLRAAAVALAGVAAPKLVEAAPRLRVSRHRIPWPGLSSPVRVAHLTDVHVGWTTPGGILDAAVEVVRRLRPDLVALTGDYVNHSLKHVDRLSAFVASLPAPVLATLGNHDHWSGPEGVTRALVAGGARVLSNESLEYTKGGVTLPIVGLDDGRTGNDDVPRAFRSAPVRHGALVLTHYPNTADAIAERGGRLVIAGHTHGGQVDVPGVTRLVSRIAGQRYLAGWYTVGGSALYVSAGIGASLDGLRGGRAAVPEVAFYELVPEVMASARTSRHAAFDGRRFSRFRPDEARYEEVLRAVSDDL